MGRGYLREKYGDKEGDRKMDTPNRQKFYHENDPNSKIKLPAKQGRNDLPYDIEVETDRHGRTVRIRHYTDHNQPNQHSNPHDHIISWDEKDDPVPSDLINYRDGEVPEF